MGKKTIIRPVQKVHVHTCGAHTYTHTHSYRDVHAYYTHICARGGMRDFSLFAKRRDTRARTRTNTHTQTRTRERTQVGRCRYSNVWVQRCIRFYMYVQFCHCVFVIRLSQPVPMVYQYVIIICAHKRSNKENLISRRRPGTSRARAIFAFIVLRKRVVVIVSYLLFVISTRTFTYRWRGRVGDTAREKSNRVVVKNTESS